MKFLMPKRFALRYTWTAVFLAFVTTAEATLLALRGLAL